MNRTDFDELGRYVSGLWPQWNPTPEQREAWFHEMRFTPLDTARQALHNAFTRTKWKEPALIDVLHAIKELRRGERVQDDPDFTPEYLEQIKRESDEDNALLADWTPQEFENGKAEVIAHEPGMVIFEMMQATGRFWRHILAERYAHGRATIYSTGIITRNGKAVRVPCANPQQISREEYWKAGPQPSRVGIKTVGNGKKERVGAQEAKVELGMKS